MLVTNQLPAYGNQLEKEDAKLFDADAVSQAKNHFLQRAGYLPTKTHILGELAKKLGVGSICIKDESTRLDLSSFKALGGSYAVIRLALEEAGRQLDRQLDTKDLKDPEVKNIVSGMVFGCATDGNHGKSVAAGARMIGASAKIFIHAGVSRERADAIADFGADVVRIDGNYDESVQYANQVCGDNNWLVVSDTSWPGYERIPGLVMQGYTTLLGEVTDSLAEAPTHIFIQAGVGGIAAVVAGYFDTVYGTAAPKIIVVEPERAACILQSALAGGLTKVDADEATIMAMLECYEPSLVAWRILSRKADAFMTVGEEDAKEAMRILANPNAPDPAIVAGESGAAGLAGLMRVLSGPKDREQLGIDASSRIFLINTEGATDKACYEKIVGKGPEAVLANNACA